MIDELQVVGDTMSESDKVVTVIGGLGPEYSSLVTSLTTRFDYNMMFVDLQTLLMDLDLRLDC